MPRCARGQMACKLIALSLFFHLSLFVAVIVDNLARTQAAANAAKPKAIPGLHRHKAS